MKNVPTTPARTASSLRRSYETTTGQRSAFRPRYARHLVRSISGVSFPLAGSIIVIYTLSGDTRRVAIVATIIAIMGHVVHSVMDLSERDQRLLGGHDEASTEGPEVMGFLD